MIQNAPPSRNPADNDTMAGTFRLVLDKFLQRTDDMLPGKVIAYNAATNLAQVQPLIIMVTTNNQQVKRAQIASVPVYQMGAGGLVLRFPVKTGDLGWIKANDRDISLFKRIKDFVTPNTQRKHKFSDAIFIPDSMLNGVTIASEDANNAVLQTYDGSIKISIGSTGIKIKAPLATFEVTQTNFVGNVNINGIAFETHRHTGVTTGTGDSGGPIA